MGICIRSHILDEVLSTGYTYIEYGEELAYFQRVTESQVVTYSSLKKKRKVPSKITHFNVYNNYKKLHSYYERFNKM